MVDVYATQVSYLRHLLPIYDALPRGHQGMIHTEMNAYELARVFDRDFGRGRPTFESRAPVLIAGGTDIPAGWSSRPVIFVEHGAGQTYLGHDTISYSGGAGRMQVVMFLNPNETVAARNRATYPTVESYVIGDPSIPDPVAVAHAFPTTVAFTWHWEQNGGPPEARSTWPYWKDAVGREIDHLLDEGIAVLGHCHPRCGPAIREWWAERNLPFTNNLDDVCVRASVLVADNTSAMYEFAALDKPVVVLNSPSYRRDVEHGLRFWEYADVGVQCDDQADLGLAIREAFYDRPATRDRRQEITEMMYPYRGSVAAELAAELILAKDWEHAPPNRKTILL